MTTGSNYLPGQFPPARLEDLLEPGEKVVYRAPRRWKPNDWLLDGSILGIGIGLVAATGLIGLDPASLATLGAAMAAPVLYTMGCYVRDWSREAVVTDLRLLHRTGWWSPRVTEVPLAEVRAIQAFRDRMRITRTDGLRLDLDHPHHCWELGSALAQVASLAPPRVATWRDWSADLVWLLSGYTLGLVAAVIPLKMLYPELAAVAESIGWLGAGTVFLAAGWLAHTLGMLCGFQLSLVLLRPFLSYTEMRDWILHSFAFWAPADEPDSQYRAAELRLAARLYGRPFDDPNGGAKSNG